MAEIDLKQYGITGTTEIVHNPSYELLFEEETKPELTGYEKGQVSELGAVNVMTGIYTGRSPKDKYIVVDENSKDTVWWTSDAYKNDNHPMTEETWKAVKDIALKELGSKRLFVVDAFCGANKDTRMAIAHRRGRMAGPLRHQHVHQADGGGAEELQAGLCRLQRLQGEGRKLQGARPELRNLRGLQHHLP